MNFFDQIGNLGSELLDTGTDIVDAVGDKFQNRVNADAARINYIQTQTQVQGLQAINDEKRKDQLLQLVMIVVYVLLAAGVGLIVLKQVKK